MIIQHLFPDRLRTLGRIAVGRSERLCEVRSSESEKGDLSVPPNSGSRSNNIDAIRLLLALLVVFSHSYPLATGTYSHEPLSWFSKQRITFGDLAVNWFFVLSGYLITQSWERSGNVFVFLQKRLLRIYPAYLVAVSICIWVVIPLSSPWGLRVYSWQTITENVWRILLFRNLSVPEAFLANPYPRVVNGSLWTIPFEAWCYLGVVFLGIASLLRRKWLIAGLFLASLSVSFGFSYFGCQTQGRIFGVIFGAPSLWARLLPYFLSGTVVYLFRDRFRWDGRLASLALVGLILGLFIPFAIPVVLPTLGTYLLFYLAFTTDWKWRGAAKYGDFSYGIYLFSHAIQQLLIMWLGRVVDPLSFFALSLPPSVLAGVLSWYLVERRFLRKSHEIRKIRPTAGHLATSRFADHSKPSVLG